jgi:hypothetical protein
LPAQNPNDLVNNSRKRLECQDTHLPNHETLAGSEQLAWARVTDAPRYLTEHPIAVAHGGQDYRWSQFSF